MANVVMVKARNKEIEMPRKGALVIRREIACRSYHKMQIEVIGANGNTVFLELDRAILAGFNLSRKVAGSREDAWPSMSNEEIIEWRRQNGYFCGELVKSHAINDPEDIDIARKYAEECF